MQDALEGLEEFAEWNTDLEILQNLHTIVLEACKEPLFTGEQFNELVQRIFEQTTPIIPQELNILKDLFHGKTISEEILKSVLTEPTKETIETIKDSQVPQPLIISRPRRFSKTRRVKGRRSITPMKRHGFKSRTRHKHHKSLVAVIVPDKDAGNPSIT